jgi:hypothetical protein
MNKLDDYRIVFIYGTDEIEKNITNGKIEYYGESYKDYLHNRYLLDYVKEKYPEVPIFNQLTIRHQRELIAYFLVKMGHIIFFNTTSKDEKEFKKYGRTGQFMMPDVITEEQELALNKFCQEIKDYDILIDYDITLEDGILNSKSIQGTGDQNPEAIIQSYNQNSKIK